MIASKSQPFFQSSEIKKKKIFKILRNLCEIKNEHFLAFDEISQNEDANLSNVSGFFFGIQKEISRYLNKLDETITIISFLKKINFGHSRNYWESS